MGDIPISDGSSACKVPTQPADIRHGLVVTDIRQAALMTILKRPDLLDPPELSLQILDGREDLGPCLAASFGLRFGKVCEFFVDSLRLGEGVEEAGEEGAFLGGYLGGGGVVGYGAVADGPDVFGAVDDKVFVDGETAAGVLLRGDLRHEVFDDGAEGVAGGPD